MKILFKTHEEAKSQIVFWGLNPDNYEPKNNIYTVKINNITFKIEVKSF